MSSNPDSTQNIGPRESNASSVTRTGEHTLPSDKMAMGHAADVERSDNFGSKVNKGGSQAALVFRYIFMSFNVSLSIAATVRAGVRLITWTILGFAIAGAVLMIIYVPITYVMSAVSKKTRFDKANVEIPYVISQVILWLVTAILSLVWLSEQPRIFDARNETRDSARVVTGLSWGNFIVCAGWLGLVIYFTARRSEGFKKALGMSTSGILQGW